MLIPSMKSICVLFPFPRPYTAPSGGGSRQKFPGPCAEGALTSREMSEFSHSSSSSLLLLRWESTDKTQPPLLQGEACHILA